MRVRASCSTSSASATWRTDDRTSSRAASSSVLAIARALANEPKVVLADEPTANLDSEAAERILELLKRLNDENGVNLVIATHDPKLLQYGKRVVRMHDGLIADA